MIGIFDRLLSDERTRSWIEHLDAIGEPHVEIALPAAGDLPAVLIDLGVPHDDVDDLVAMLPIRDRSQEVWWLLERCTFALVRRMGTVVAPATFPVLTGTLGVLGRYFYVYVYLAAFPYVKAFHRERDIPESISRMTLVDLGRKMTVHRQRHGVGGLEGPEWLQRHFGGTLYQLGRLQFERGCLGNRTGSAIAAAGLPFGPGGPTLSIHIPRFSGPLKPDACDASFAQARSFFARHFREQPYRIGVCHSWLLDEQLAEYLPTESNIMRFQRRFRIVHQTVETDDGMVRWVFGRDDVALDDLPQRTSLERAVVSHLKAGRHWHGGAGWLSL